MAFGIPGISSPSEPIQGADRSTKSPRTFSLDTSCLDGA
jgi:hypothetical protein